MKKALRCLLLSAVMALALGAAALAAETDPTVENVASGATVSFQTGNEKLTVSYTDKDLAGSQCIILMVKGTADEYTITDTSILYIDQAAADANGTVTFNNENDNSVYPTSVQNSVILLGGPSTGPVVLAEIKVPYKLGDVDNSGGDADIGDATLLLRYIAALEKADALNLAAADVDRNGKVDIGDATKLLRVLAKYDTLE